MSHPLRGLARNPALPPSALLRLAGDDRVSRWDLTARASWTDAAFDTLAAHPDPEVRESLAQSPGATGDQRARLVGDLNIRVLQAVLEGPPSRWAGPLPDWVYRRLAGHPEPLVRDLLVYLPGTPRDIVALLARDQHPGIADAARALLDRKPYEPPSLGRDQAVRFASGGSDWDRERAAADPALPSEWVAALAADPSPRVRLAVSTRPGLTEAQRAAIDYPADAAPPLEWVLAAGPAELDRCARSAHPALRRGAACHPDLPADLLAALTADPDPVVRALLCAHQAHAPGELVLQTYLATGDDDLLRHPAFPRTDLARLADDPAPEARALVMLDPATPPAVIEQLSHDPSGPVRSAAAADARLPQARLLALLESPATAEAAAANPALPPRVISRLLADLGVR
ncbi:hypothetical protein [Actinoplanes subglobosus]|uniref:Leucine rich repeat variant n=1 Tax=Actinoplanes subglobosus TaxID=1547892 RepID=A0ABV8J456_9ACTN